jgi:flagellar basal body-associated protein FliL
MTGANELPLAGLNAFGPFMCGLFILFITLLILLVIIVIPIAVVYYFLGPNKSTQTLTPKELEIQPDEFTGW